MMFGVWIHIFIRFILKWLKIVLVACFQFLFLFFSSFNFFCLQFRPFVSHLPVSSLSAPYSSVEHIVIIGNNEKNSKKKTTLVWKIKTGKSRKYCSLFSFVLCFTCEIFELSKSFGLFGMHGDDLWQLGPFFFIIHWWMIAGDTRKIIFPVLVFFLFCIIFSDATATLLPMLFVYGHWIHWVHPIKKKMGTKRCKIYYLITHWTTGWLPIYSITHH